MLTEESKGKVSRSMISRPMIAYKGDYRYCVGLWSVRIQFLKRIVLMIAQFQGVLTALPRYLQYPRYHTMILRTFLPSNLPWIPPAAAESMRVA